MHELELEAWLDKAVELDSILKDTNSFVKQTIESMGTLVKEHLALKAEHIDLNKKYGLLLQSVYHDRVRRGEIQGGKPMKL